MPDPGLIRPWTRVRRQGFRPVKKSLPMHGRPPLRSPGAERGSGRELPVDPRHHGTIRPLALNASASSRTGALPAAPAAHNLTVVCCVGNVLLLYCMIGEGLRIAARGALARVSPNIVPDSGVVACDRVTNSARCGPAPQTGSAQQAEVGA